VDELDYRKLFESSPGLLLVVRPDPPTFTIVAASDAYLAATMTERESILGRGIFDVFPDNPADLRANATRNLRASLERVLATGAPDTMALQKYDVRRPNGEFEERYWSPVNAPAFNREGKLSYIIHRVEDVTSFVLDGHRHTRANAELQTRADGLQAELFLRARDLDRANQQLRDANDRVAALGESQLRALFDFMPQLGWTARPDGFIDFYNRGWFEYTGLTLEELQGTGWKAVHDPAWLPIVVERWDLSIATGTPFEMEFPLRRRDGVFRWFLTRVNPVRDEDGRVVRWIGINTDIDEQRRAGTQLETRLRLLLESIRDYAVFMLDAEGRIATWNPGAQRLKQWRADEIIGKHFSVFYPEVDIRAGKPARELEVASREGRIEDEGWRLRKDGSRFWASVVISAIRDQDGQLLGFSKVTRDLTDQKQAEEERVRLAEEQQARKAAQESEERFRFLAEASAILGSSLDYEATLQTVADLVVPRYADWCVVDVLEEGRIAPVAVSHSDPSKVELARELQRRWPPRPDAKNGTPNVLRTGRSELYSEIPDEVLIQGAQDEEHLRIARELNLRSALIVPLPARGATLGALTLVWAESPQRYSTSDVPLMEELGRRAGIAVDNARLYREVQNAVRLRDEFLSIASHELKTPLTTILLQISAMERSLRAVDKVDIAKLGQRVGTIDRHINRLAGLIEELLDVARATAGRIQLNAAPVDLDEVVREATERLKPNFAMVGSELTVDLRGPRRGLWDRSRLDQVVTNLLTNAIKYGGGKPIHVATSATDDAAVLTVRDAGIGIAKTDQSRIFERFGRAVPAENYGGLGLGLWIAKELVDAMGGRITVESSLGEGAVFTVVLPLGESQNAP
jgi:PAS domain S-box-containing protein